MATSFFNPLTGPAGQAVTLGNLDDNGEPSVDEIVLDAGATLTYTANGSTIDVDPGTGAKAALRKFVSFSSGEKVTVYIGMRDGSNPASNRYLVRMGAGGTIGMRLRIATDNAGEISGITNAGGDTLPPAPLDRRVIYGIQQSLGGAGKTIELRRWDAPSGSPDAIPDVTAAPTATTGPITATTNSFIDDVQVGNTAANNTGGFEMFYFRVSSDWVTAGGSTVTAGATQSVTVGQPFTLSAAGTPAGGTYAWAPHPTDPGVAASITLSGANTATATGTAPATEGYAQWQVTYTPPSGTSSTASVRRNFVIPPSTGTTTVVRTDRVFLDATANAGDVRIEQIAGPQGITVTENPADYFTLDTTQLDGEAEFNLIERDAFGQDLEPVRVVVNGYGNVDVSGSLRYWDHALARWLPEAGAEPPPPEEEEPPPPVTNLEASLSVTPSALSSGGNFSVVATASGGSGSYTYTFSSSPTLTLTGTGASRTGTAPNASATYTFTVTVSDGTSTRTATDTLTVTSGLATGAVIADRETPPPPGGTADEADDMCIWRDDANPSRSVVIGVSKDTNNGGLGVYDMNANQLSFREDGEMNNVDIRTGVPLGGTPRVLVACSNRTNNRVDFYEFNPSTRTLTPRGNQSLGFKPYGCALYQTSTGQCYVFLSETTTGSGQLDQYRINDGGSQWTATKVRDMSTSSQSEGMVVDDATGTLYLCQEDVGLFKYNALPSGGTSRTEIDRVGAGRMQADVEGVTIVKYPAGDGYILVSNQGANNFLVYDLAAPHRHRRTFTVSGNGAGVDGVSTSDGIDAIAKPMGPNYPHGLLVVHDNANTGSAVSNLKYARLEQALRPLASWEASNP